MSKPPPGTPARFWSRINVGAPDRCWLFTGKARTPDGLYGVVTYQKKYYRAHVLAYVLANGLVPVGQEVHHSCRNGLCCNPRHLVAKTRFQHTHEPGHIAAIELAKTHCPQGHEYTESNTYRYNGSRYCRICRNAHAAASHRRSGR